MKKILRSSFALFIAVLFTPKQSAAQAWSPVGGGIYGLVYDLMSYNGDLYAAGKFTSTANGTANHIAVWNGSSWSTLGTGLNNDVFCMAVYHNEIYVGGKFLTAGGITATRIAKWTGSAWAVVGTGVGMDDVVRSLAVDPVNDVLYAAGDFTTVDGTAAQSVAKWNGTSWSAVGSLSPGSVETICMYNNQLVAGGNFGAAGSTNIAIWTGSAWVNTGLSNGAVGNVHTLYVHNSLLYIGGGISQLGSVPANFIATWDGNTFTALGNGLATPTPSGSGKGVKAIEAFGTDIYAGGEFLNSNGVPMKYIAKWDGVTWDSVGTGMNNIVYALCTHNTDLYAAGQFSTADGATAFYIARLGAGTTQVGGASSEKAIELYPNPSNGHVIIKVDDELATLVMHNGLGEKVMEQKVLRGATNLDVSFLPPGMYSVKIANEKRAIIKKLIVE